MRVPLRPALVLAVACLWAPVGSAAQAPGPAGQAPETIAEIRVHGNHASDDAAVLVLAGIAVGDRFEPGTIAAVTERLKASGRFDDVEVLKRYASIADLSRITVVIVVNEGPVRIVMPGEEEPGVEPKVVRRRFGNFMWLPILQVEDGYGATYGARVAYVGLASERNRLSFPLTWGGRRQAGVDFSRTFAEGLISHVALGAAIEQAENPAFEKDDTRRKAWGRVEHVTGPVRTGGGVGWQRVDFDGARDRIASVGADVAFDTRRNPVLPRNAVLGRVAWERLDISARGVVHRVRLDGEAWVGTIRGSVLALRAFREDVDRPVPPYLRSLLGGWSSLRGFRAGAFTGDTVVAGSAEWLVPLTSPLRVGQLGLSAFVDAGAAYDEGARLRDQSWRTGFGGSVWVTLTAFRMSVAVAHGRGSGTRGHVGGGFSF